MSHVNLIMSHKSMLDSINSQSNSSSSKFILYWTSLVPSIGMDPFWQHLPLQAFLLERLVSTRPSTRQYMPFTALQVFLGWPRPPVGFNFWTFFSQPLPCSTWPYHLSQQMWSTFARLPSCILSRRSCKLTWSLVLMPHIQHIITQSLCCRWCKSDKVGTQVLIAWSRVLLMHTL